MALSKNCLLISLRKRCVLLCSYIIYVFMLDFCINKPDGLQADPVDCRAYYDCAKGKTRHRTGLSVGLMLDPETRQFRHSDKVNCTVRKGEFKPKKK